METLQDTGKGDRCKIRKEYLSLEKAKKEKDSVRNLNSSMLLSAIWIQN